MTEVIKYKPYMPHEEKAEFYRINGGKPAIVTRRDGTQEKGKLGRFTIQGATGRSIIIEQGMTEKTVRLEDVRRIDLE